MPAHHPLQTRQHGCNSGWELRLACRNLAWQGLTLGPESLGTGAAAHEDRRPAALPP